MSITTRGRSLAAFIGVVAGSIAAFVILFAFTAFVMVRPVHAADKGGGCCADLEERVAELEATVAKKGNRKVTVQVYGQVNAGILMHDLDGTLIPKKRVIDGSQNPTLFGIMGEGKVSPNVKAGYRIEVELNTRAGDESAYGDWANGQANQLSIRHAYVWLEGAVGRLSVGKTSMATDGIAEITVSNVDVAAKMLSLEPVSTAYLGGFNLPFDGSRRNVVRYDSPTFGGFIISAAWGTGDTVAGLGGVNHANENVYDVALRYAGEFGGFRVAAGVGYRDENKAIFLGTDCTGGDLCNRLSVLAGSASVKHMTSGLFANVAAGRVDGEFFTPPSGPRTDLTGIHGQAGWEKNVFGIGNTTLYGEWAQTKMQGEAEKGTMIGAGLVQALDAAAMDLYISWRQYDTGSYHVQGLGEEVDFNGKKPNVFMFGARAKF